MSAEIASAARARPEARTRTSRHSPVVGLAAFAIAGLAVQVNPVESVTEPAGYKVDARVGDGSDRDILDALFEYGIIALVIVCLSAAVARGYAYFRRGSGITGTITGDSTHTQRSAHAAARGRYRAIGKFVVTFTVMCSLVGAAGGIAEWTNSGFADRFRGDDTIVDMPATINPRGTAALAITSGVMTVAWYGTASGHCAWDGRTRRRMVGEMRIIAAARTVRGTRIRPPRLGGRPRARSTDCREVICVGLRAPRTAKHTAGFGIFGYDALGHTSRPLPAVIVLLGDPMKRTPRLPGDNQDVNDHHHYRAMTIIRDKDDLRPNGARNDLPPWRPHGRDDRHSYHSDAGPTRPPLSPPPLLHNLPAPSFDEPTCDRDGRESGEVNRKDAGQYGRIARRSRTSRLREAYEGGQELDDDDADYDDDDGSSSDGKGQGAARGRASDDRELGDEGNSDARVCIGGRRSGGRANNGDGHGAARHGSDAICGDAPPPPPRPPLRPQLYLRAHARRKED